jgi:hypothetical protein
MLYWVTNFIADWRCGKICYPHRRPMVKDRFGLSRKIVPKALIRLISDPDANRVGCAMKAIMEMKSDYLQKTSEYVVL